MATRGSSWRTVDVVVGAVIAVAFGVVFWGWDQLYAWFGTAFDAFPPGKALVGGVWLLSGVFGALVVRKPGAALFTELVAGVVESLLGSQFGISNIWYGLAQGALAELAFLAFRYRRHGLPVAMLAGAGAGLAESLLDWANYYRGYSAGWVGLYVLFALLSGAVIAGAGSWALVRSMAPTGVLDQFRAGRDRVRV